MILAGAAVQARRLAVSAGVSSNRNGTHVAPCLRMPKAPIVEERRMFRALPGIDMVFLAALGVAGLAACLVIGLR